MGKGVRLFSSGEGKLNYPSISFPLRSMQYLSAAFARLFHGEEEKTIDTNILLRGLDLLSQLFRETSFSSEGKNDWSFFDGSFSAEGIIYPCQPSTTSAEK